MGVHGYGIGVVDCADEGFEAPSRGGKGMSIMPGRAWVDVHPL